MSKIPIYQPYMGSEERELVDDCMTSTWISSQGKYIEEFENKVAEKVGSKYAIAVSNGTVALHLAMLALDIGPGDEVITTNFTYVASSNSILYVGATPIFVDIDPNAWNIDVNEIENAITSSTKAILYTNIYGATADYDAIVQIAEKHNLHIIEDAAESFGSTYKGKMSGTLGDISTFSFFGNKTITTGEGGMVLTSDDNLAAKISQLKNQGNSPVRRYFHDVLGYNYRMTNIQAAIGVAQLRKLDEILAKKSMINQSYKAALEESLSFQNILENTTSSYWMCSILCDRVDQKEHLVRALESNGIETRPFFTPIDELPFYKKGNYPVSRDISSRGINLPSFPGLKEHQIEHIINTIRDNIK